MKTVSERPMRCEYYNRTKCETSGQTSGCGAETETCRPPDGNDKSSLCYALWQNSSDKGLVTEFKGCWFGSPRDCAHRHNCIENRRETKKHLFFCCCDGDLCNENITHMPVPHTLWDTNTTTTGISTADQSLGQVLPAERLFGSASLSLALITVVPLLSLLALLFAGYSYKSYRKRRTTEVPTSEDLLISSCPPSPYVGLRPIQLQEIKAQGKFGSVWKANDGSANLVAVKIFSLQDRTSWQIEQEVYRLPQMKHKNLLTYLGAERRGEGLATEYWLISEYHVRGSLYDYLKANAVDWHQLLNIAQGIARGLTHLHEELPGPQGLGSSHFKPSIAHRDFKSKNVLLTKDLNACIADFGLALVFYPASTCGEAHGQVGTRRYMAPEVLEGAINFSRDSFLRIDMYACGLVLWELLSRCKAADIQPDDYQLPFEEEVGQHPTLEDMQEIVAQQKKRPLLRDAWLRHEPTRALCHTIEDCWDHDAEARLSASCVEERLQTLMASDLPLIITNLT